MEPIELLPGILLRRAVAEDVRPIATLLALDPLGRTRESPGDPAYLQAFERIDADPNQLLLVLERESKCVGTLQLSFLHGLSLRGATRAQIEAVRIDEALRGQAIGRALIRWVIDHARERGCRLVQLTTDKTRERAHRFYADLGFVASHEGMKLRL